MAGHSRHGEGEGLGPSFWILFIVGLVIVLSLFRGFAAAVGNARRREGTRKSVKPHGHHQD